MRLLKYLPVAALCLSPLWAVAQQNAPTLGNTPPRLDTLDEGDAPAITIRKPDSGNKIIEQRENGKVKQVQVKSGGSTYYVKPGAPPGSSMPGDAESNLTRPAQWQVLEFDFGRRKEAKEVEPAQVLLPAPPIAPALSPPAKK